MFWIQIDTQKLTDYYLKHLYPWEQDEEMMLHLERWLRWLVGVRIEDGNDINYVVAHSASIVERLREFNIEHRVVDGEGANVLRKFRRSF